MTREEQIEEFIKLHAHKFSVRYGYETIEELMREMAQWCDNNPKNPWISVEERLPEKINKFMSEPVLCRYTRGSKEYFLVSHYDFEFDEWQISNVTHWMPIPELKKGELK